MTGRYGVRRTVVSAYARCAIAVTLAAALALALPASSLAASPSAASPSVRPSPSAVPSTTVFGDLITPGRLVICTSFPRTRFAELDAQGQPFGVDVEIGQGIALAMGLEAEVRDILFEDLIDAVEDRQCDAVVAGHFITSVRLERMHMTAYRQGTPNVIVRAGDPLADGDLVDLCGRSFGVVAGTVYVEIVRGLGDYVGKGIDDGCRRVGEPVVDLREYPTQPDAEGALESGDTDAYAGNEAIAVDRPDVFEFGPALEQLRNGIGTRKGAEALRAAVRAALGAMIADRSYLAILERYGVAGVAVTSAP